VSPNINSVTQTPASHGPDAGAYARASAAGLAPRQLDGPLASMFESRWAILPT
jgi:homogentisate 1,2-dioxygenase